MGVANCCYERSLSASGRELALPLDCRRACLTVRCLNCLLRGQQCNATLPLQHALGVAWRFRCLQQKSPSPSRKAYVPQHKLCCGKWALEAAPVGCQLDCFQASVGGGKEQRPDPCDGSMEPLDASVRSWLQEIVTFYKHMSGCLRLVCPSSTSQGGGKQGLLLGCPGF